MKISAEISMYPLSKDYEYPILRFIKELHQHPRITVTTNTMSTQIFGAYEDVMNALNSEIRAAFQAEPIAIMVLKIVNADLSPKKA